MEYPDQLKTPVPTGRPGVDALDDFLWETASWDPAVESLLEKARRDGADQGSAAAAQQLLDEPLVTEPGMVYRLVRLLAEAGELNTDNLAAPRCGPPGGTRPGSAGDPLGAALPLVGRETELSRAEHGATRRRAGVSVLCITGPTGIGKTRLARAIVTAIGQQAPGDDQLEISLSSAAPGPGNRQLARTAYDALAELLAQLGVRDADIPATFAGRRARYAAELADRRPVVLLDGVIDQSQVLPLLPPRQGSVVVTGRAPLTGLNDWGAAPLPLGPLNRIGSRLLVKQVFATFGIEPDDRATDALYEWCARRSRAHDPCITLAGHGGKDRTAAFADADRADTRRSPWRSRDGRGPRPPGRRPAGCRTGARAASGAGGRHLDGVPQHGPQPGPGAGGA